MWVSTCCRVRHEAAEALGAIGNDKCECMLRQFEDDHVLEVSGLASTGAAPCAEACEVEFQCSAPGVDLLPANCSPTADPMSCHTSSIVTFFSTSYTDPRAPALHCAGRGDVPAGAAADRAGTRGISRGARRRAVALPVGRPHAGGARRHADAAGADETAIIGVSNEESAQGQGPSGPSSCLRFSKACASPRPFRRQTGRCWCLAIFKPQTQQA